MILRRGNSRTRNEIRQDPSALSLPDFSMLCSFCDVSLGRCHSVSRWAPRFGSFSPMWCLDARGLSINLGTNLNLFQDCHVRRILGARKALLERTTLAGTKCKACSAHDTTPVKQSSRVSPWSATQAKRRSRIAVTRQKASRMIRSDIFDWPRRRWAKRIGSSWVRKPWRWQR